MNAETSGMPGFDGVSSDREAPVELKTKIWMNGNLEWFAYLGDETVFLGGKEVPYPLREGDRWTNEAGDSFRVRDGEIVRER
jgi:hypothetical protein